MFIQPLCFDRADIFPESDRVHSSGLNQDGFTILPGVVSSEGCAVLIADVGQVMKAQPAGAIEAGKGRVVGGRNLMDTLASWRVITDKPVVRQFVREHVGLNAGVVRILYFDKPPGRGWSLSFHRDRTIAVAQHHVPPEPFAKPTVKTGVPHVEATEELLSRMLTLRLHLDPMHENNGPLVVIPGSHIVDDRGEQAEIKVVSCDAGDLFAMRPLLSHGSRAANQDTTDHRRVLHLEIAPDAILPAPYQWHRFESV